MTEREREREREREFRHTGLWCLISGSGVWGSETGRERQSE